MVMTDDFYEALGISRDASDAEIKSAYKKAARKYHPDNSETGNEEMFKKVGEAYETLKDPQKRTIYDQYGAEGLKGGFGGAGGFGGFSGFQGGGAGFEDISDIFSSFFGDAFGGGGGRSRRHDAPKRGQDHRVDIDINFLDPVNELKKKIKFNPLVECSSCKGKGAENPQDVITCSTCDGAGQVMSVQNTILGQIRQNQTCPSCRGTGKTIKNPCKPCKGQGFKRENKEIEVAIPAGVHDGAQIRLAGMGDAGRNGGPPGDIYLVININPDKRFQRERENIFSEVQIGIAEAALGTKFMIPTVHGETELKIKAGTQPEDIYTLKSEGMPKLNNPARRGDHYVRVHVQTPQGLSGKEKKLLEEFMDLRRGKDNKI